MLRTSRHRKSAAVLAVVVAALLAAPGPVSGAVVRHTASGAAAQPILIGDESDLSGFFVTWLGRNPQHDGYVAATDYVNAHGGIDGHPIKLLTCDGKSDTARAAICAEQFITEHVLATVGWDNGWGEGGVLKSEAAGIPNVGYPDTVNEMNGPLSFPLLGGGYDSYPAQVKYFAQVKHVTRVVVFFLDAPVGYELEAVYNQALKKWGVPDVTDIPYSATSADPTAAVTRVKEANPQVVFYVGIHPNEAIEAASEVGLGGCSKVPWTLGDIAIEKSFIDAVGPLADGCYGDSATRDYLHSNLNAQTKVFQDAMHTYMPNVYIFQNTATGFATMMTLANIIKKIGVANLTRTSLVNFLKNVSHFPVYMGQYMDHSLVTKAYPHNQDPWYMITEYYSGSLHFVQWENGWS